MTDQIALQLLVTAGVLVSGPFALRSTYRLWKLWRQDDGRSLLLLASWVVALIVTVAGAWIGFLLLRRMLGFEALDWSPPITGVATVIVLQVPAILDGLVDRVGRQRGPDNISRGSR